MVVIGLTGSIGMGKTTASAMLRCMGIPVHDSDAAVHGLMGPGGAAVPALSTAFPEAVDHGLIDRSRLGRIVFSDEAALHRLEAILHPLVARSALAFVARNARERRNLVVLDIPLLFETRQTVRCDLVAVVSAPSFVQRQRVLARPGMTEDRFRAVLRRQTPDQEKRRRADVVIPTGLGRGETWRRLAILVATARTRRGGAWPPNPYRQRKNGRGWDARIGDGYGNDRA